MSLKKKVFGVLASIIVFSLGATGQAQAAEIEVTVGDGWHSNIWFGGPGTTLSDSYVLTNGSGVWVEITDGYVLGDEFEVFNNGISLGQTTSSDLNGSVNLGLGRDAAWAQTRYSWGTFELSPGAALVSFILTKNAAGYLNGANSIRFVSSPSRLMPSVTSPDVLRLDTAGVTTLKNNVLSCSPGAYTFLNSGATAESAKIESYVYTLFVNGKAVSTLSTDGFKSVDAGLFPTIAGNLVGTATTTGASWDLKGLSNYSAQCQVYAVQGGSSIQSSTTVVYDAVALAAQAEAAAKAQATKDMITTWAANNEDLAKKYRDARLAGKG